LSGHPNGTVMKLAPEAAAEGVRLAVYDVLGSTNEESLRLARAGERGPLWLVAARQTAGRGRRGRAWISAPGNLHASLLLADPAPVARWHELSFVAALAAHDALVHLAPTLARRLTIKWPNDLLLNGRKVAGILVEGEVKDAAVTVGIGLNCCSHPATEPAANLAAAGTPLTREAVFGALSAAMLRRLRQWARGAGFQAVRGDWLARAGGLGEEIRVRLGDRDIRGRFEALDERGGLVVRLAAGNTTTIAAGDVILASPHLAQ
jgi:BirA family biotin operon repressor/biotin-[acetyl-CoA-carboxylase] ligase